MMNLRQLRTFTMVAEQGSIRAAARLQHLTQPAVTRAVRELEASVGVALVRRSAKGVELTEYGQALLKRANVIFEEARRAQDELLQMRDGAGGRLDVAFSSTVGMTILPQAMRAFRARMPKIELALSEGSLPLSKDELALGRIDFAVLHEYGNDNDDGFARTTLFESPLVVVARTGHPLRRAGSIVALQKATWLFPGSKGSAEMPLLRTFRSLRVPPPEDVILCASTVAALRIIQQSDVLGFFSRYLFVGRPWFSGLTTLAVKETLPPARVSIVTRRASPLTHAAQQFIECLQEAARTLSLPDTAPARTTRSRRP